MSAEGSKKAIVAALTANAGIAIAKFVGFVITGSSSMLAEAVHSVADTSNQGLLLAGHRQAAKKANKLHPFGYGRARYFYSFVVALVLFSLGSMFALYEGIEKIRAPHDLESPIVAIGILVFAILLECYSFYTAYREVKLVKGQGVSWWSFIRNSRSPELPVVLLEDAAALLGLVLALVSVALTMATGDPIYDGIGTLCIGILLGVVAIILIIEMKSLLIGEGVTDADEESIVNALISDPGIDRVIHLKTQYLGPDEVLVAAKIAVPSNNTIGELALVIDEAEARIREKVPAARVIYLEPDVDRTASS